MQKTGAENYFDCFNILFFGQATEVKKNWVKKPRYSDSKLSEAAKDNLMPAFFVNYFKF